MIQDLILAATKTTSDKKRMVIEVENKVFSGGFGFILDDIFYDGTDMTIKGSNNTNIVISSIQNFYYVEDYVEEYATGIITTLGGEKIYLYLALK